MNETLYCTVNYHYENIPRFVRESMSKWFIKNRHEVVSIYNNLINWVNQKWDTTDKPCSFGEYAEDINPEYVKLIQKLIQPSVDLWVNTKFRMFKYKIDEYGDIVAYIPFIKGSKLWITLNMIES